MKHLSLLKETEYHSTKELQKRQFILLKKFLLHASLNSEFYRELFLSHGLKVDEIKNEEELRALPILEKEQIREYSSKIDCSVLYGKTIKSQTSGGTRGNPLVLMLTEKCYQIENAYIPFSFSWYGLKTSNRIAKCAGHVVVSKEQTNPPFWVSDSLNNSLYLSSYHLTEENLEHYIMELKRFRPEILAGYPSSLYLIALANISYKANIKLKLVRTGSETLHDYQRDTIMNSFDCRIMNFYGSGEACVKACECPEGKIHLQMLHGFTEVIKENGEKAHHGESGRVVATGFSNYAYPLIRYNMDDEVLLSEDQVCKCGRGGILLDSIIGRTVDYIITPEGEKISQFTKLFRDIDGVKNGQIVQDKIEEITLCLVVDNTYNKKAEKIIINNARGTLGNTIRINIKYVEQIERSNNAKFKFILSSLDKEMFGQQISNTDSNR